MIDRKRFSQIWLHAKYENKNLKIKILLCVVLLVTYLKPCIGKFGDFLN
jgi:hypothetical protein